MKKSLFSGFSIPELLIVIAILGILFSLSGVNLLNTYGRNTLGTTVTTIAADIKQQQLKAMVGDTEGEGTPEDFGIYFQPDGLSYVLFKGSSYSSIDPSNFSIELNKDLQFSNISVPTRQIIFAKNSGEVSNYDPNLDNITLRNINTEDTKTLRINQYGTIISLN